MFVFFLLIHFVRFYGRIARGPDCHEEDILQAIRDNANGLAGDIFLFQYFAQFDLCFSLDLEGPSQRLFIDIVIIGILLTLTKTSAKAKLLCEESRNLNTFSYSNLHQLITCS